MSDHTWSLYKHTSPSGKVYIGITKNINERWGCQGKKYKGSNRIWYAIQKYGWDNFKHEIIMDGLTREEASEREKEYIAMYNSTDERFGYNLTSGGFDGVPCQESIEKTRAALLGHSVPTYIREAISNAQSIEIICLETHEVFKSAREAEKKTGICSSSIGKVCNGAASNAGGFHFAKMSDYENGTIPQFEHQHNGKRVICLETGKVYESQRKAAKDYGVSSQAISHCCSGKVETSAGKHWRFFEEDDIYKRNRQSV